MADFVPPVRTVALLAPRAGRSVLGHDIRLGAPAAAIPRAHVQGRGPVGVDAHDVQVRAELVDSPHLDWSDVGHDRHRRMVRVDLLGGGGDVVDGLPEQGVVAGFAGPLHLVADAPQEDGRMVLEALDDVLGVLKLPGDGGGVGVVEPAVAADADADGDGQAQCLGLVKFLGAGRAPGPEGVGPGLGELLLGGARRRPP